MRHTPLPWSTNGTFVWITSDNTEIGKRGEDLAFVPAGENSTEREANAAYIVKACNAFPDLVEALKELLDRFVKICPDADGKIDPADQKRIDKASKVITKAGVTM